MSQTDPNKTPGRPAMSRAARRLRGLWWLHAMWCGMVLGVLGMIFLAAIGFAYVLKLIGVFE